VLWFWMCISRVHLLQVAWYVALHQSSVTFLYVDVGGLGLFCLPIERLVWWTVEVGGFIPGTMYCMVVR